MSVFHRLTVLKNIRNQLTKKPTIALITGHQHHSNDSKNVLHSDLSPVTAPHTTLDQYVLEHSGKWSQYVATECGLTGRRYTYEEVVCKSRNFNKALRKKLRLDKGDVIAILLPNVPEFVIVALGALKAGLVITTLNPIYTPDEISHQLKDSSAKVIVTLGALWNLAQKSAQLTGQQIPIIGLKFQPDETLPTDAIDLKELLDTDFDYPDIQPPDPNEIALLPYSSGTTGLPKGVQLTHKNLISNLCQINHNALRVYQDTTKDHQDIFPAILPSFHIYGLVATTLNTLLNGCKTITLPQFTPDSYLKVLRQHRPDVLFIAPPIVLFLAGHLSVTPADLKSIRSINSGAAPLAASDAERFAKKAQRSITILQGYGLTECSPLVSMTRHDLNHLSNVNGSIGRAISNTSVKIVDPENPNGEAFGPNQTGEILVKGPQVMKGYHNQPEETKKSFVDGWLRTGDMGYYNDDNLLFLTDRLKELIKVKGFQVMPAQLEEIIRNYPDVDDAAVIGVPHATDGEVPRAYIVAKPDKTIDLMQLEEYVANKVAPYKRLRGGIEFIDRIPKNASGKTLRRHLKMHFENKR